MLEGDIEFEVPFKNDLLTYNSNRKRKLYDIIYKVDIPNCLRTSLIDAFNRVEQHFLSTNDRTNFINVEHLCRELTIMLGYPEYSKLFKGLKTPSRSKRVNAFINEVFGQKEKINLKRLADFDVVTCQGYDVDYRLDYACPNNYYTDKYRKD